MKSVKKPNKQLKFVSKNLKHFIDDETDNKLCKKPDKDKKRLTKKRKHEEESSSSSEDEPVPIVSTDDEDSDGEECIYCNSSKTADRSGEQWCKCISCGRWTHYLCAGVEGNQWKTYVCDFCVTHTKV